MAACFLHKTIQLSRYFKRCASNVTAAIPLTESVPVSPIPGTAPSVSDTVQITTLPNGVTVASKDTLLPYSSFAVYIKSGSRVECYDNQGLTHLLRNCAFLSTEDKTSFALQREVDFVGGTMSCSTTREHIIYSSDCLREHQAQVLSSIFETITKSTFHHYEVDRQRERVSLSIAKAASQPDTIVFEALHKAAFRNGLSNSLYSPHYNVSKFTDQQLIDFCSQWYIGQQFTVVGVGTDHESLVKYCQSGLTLPEGMKQSIDKAEYVGGNEVRIDTDSTLAHVGISCKGISLYSSTEPVAGVVQFLLGGGPRIKWGSGSATARLSKAVASKVDAPFVVNATNIRYSDNGLFGFYAVADGNIMGQVLSNAMKEFNEIGRGNLSNDDLLCAKNQYKADILMNLERQTCNDIGIEVSLTGSYKDVQENIKAIDAVSTQDVIGFIKTVFATRPTLVCYGNLSTTPRLDELLNGISFK